VGKSLWGCTSEILVGFLFEVEEASKKAQEQFEKLKCNIKQKEVNYEKQLLKRWKDAT
jgi:hypothetical protein